MFDTRLVNMKQVLGFQWVASIFSWNQILLLTHEAVPPVNLSNNNFYKNAYQKTTKAMWKQCQRCMQVHHEMVNSRVSVREMNSFLEQSLTRITAVILGSIQTSIGVHLQVVALPAI